MTILVVFGGFFGVRFNYSECISKTRHKYVPVGSLMPFTTGRGVLDRAGAQMVAMALDGLGYTLRTVKSQCQYRDLNVFVSILSVLASCFVLDFCSIRNSTVPIHGRVPSASMQSCVGMHTGFRRLLVWVTTGTEGTKIKTFGDIVVKSIYRDLMYLVPMLRVGMHCSTKSLTTRIPSFITAGNKKFNSQAESLC